MNAIWKDIKNYPNYKISAKGNVLSIGRYINSGVFGYKSWHKQRILKKQKNADNYFMVKLYKNGVGKSMVIHRLVGGAFIPNPENKPQINHKDGNKHNNNIDNLEWVSNKENAIHAAKLGLIHNEKKVGQYKNNLLLKIFDSIYEASIITKINKGNISSCCSSNRRKTAGGYEWRHILSK